MDLKKGFLVVALTAFVAGSVILKYRNYLKTNETLETRFLDQPIPHVLVEDLDGKPAYLDDPNNKRTFINFWATWCPPCRAEFPAIEELYKEHGESVGFYIVNRGQNAEEVRSFLGENNYSFPVYLDPDRRAYNQFTQEGIPLTVIARENRVTYVHVGRLTKESLEEEILK